MVSRNAMLAASQATDKKTSNSLCNIISFIDSVYLLQAANERCFETQMIYNFLKNTYMYINDTINFHWLLFPR